jgi:hypothetical protein
MCVRWVDMAKLGRTIGQKSDSELIGSLKVKNNFIVGLRKPLYENGAEPGDLCLLIFDMGRRRVALQLGGPDLVDRITENISSTELYADPLLD